MHRTRQRGMTLLAGAALPLLLFVPRRAAAPPPFTVEIPVLVLDHRGQPVLQLDQDQFRLSDNGRRQRLTGFDRSARPVSLAIVVDTRDRDALAQVQRSAQLLAAMVMGANGEASVYVAGPQPRAVLGFTRDPDQVVATLRHLTLAPAAPLGHGQATEPAALALVALSHRPASQARAVLIIAKDADAGGPAASTLLDDAQQQAIAIFRLAPQRPDHTPEAVNPDTVAVGGAGQGSQRIPQMPASAAARGTAPLSGHDQLNLDLTPVARTAVRLGAATARRHAGDYVYASGGLTLSAGDNADFDRKLSSIGADLRSYYYLDFRPDDLGMAAARHQVGVSVLPLNGGDPPAELSFRRLYWAPGR